MHKNRVIPSSTPEDRLREECYLRWSVLSSNLHHVQKLQDLIEGAIGEAVRESRQAFAETYATGVTGNAQLDRGMDVAYAYAHPVVSRPALFAIACGHAEYELEAICGAAAAVLPNAATFVSRGESSMEKMNRFLRDVVGLDMPAIAGEWKSWGDYYAVRSALLHSRGFLRDHKRPDAFGTSPVEARGIEIDGNSRVLLKPSFLPEFIESQSLLWRELDGLWRRRWS